MKVTLWRVNKRQGDKLVYGVAEISMPTVSDVKDFIIKVEAVPINPSDLGSLGMLARFGAVPFPQALEGMFKADGDTKPLGNEGAGVVVAAGSAPEAQDLLGKRVAVTGGSSYAQYTKTSLNNPMFAVYDGSSDAREKSGAMIRGGRFRPRFPLKVNNSLWIVSRSILVVTVSS